MNIGSCIGCPSVQSGRNIINLAARMVRLFLNQPMITSLPHILNGLWIDRKPAKIDLFHMFDRQAGKTNPT
ncbi:hypothetical protein [Aeromonas sp. MdU4]|uniref:hypothetical protein n=1 Tax=Aeromonas sp. MdU4 TaxID=3342819 RepID=UPI0035B86FE8